MDVAPRHSAAAEVSGQRAARLWSSLDVRRGAAFALAGLLAFATGVVAQEPEKRTPLILEVVKDPTTYVPAGLFYTAMRLDWESSQPFFQHGFVEDNAGYTQSGLAKDAPLSNADGKQQILKDALTVLPASIANNALMHMLERRLSDRYPQHRKLWKTLSWIERAAFAGFTSYKLAAPHFQQWQTNERLAKQYGFVQP
jgi:hypothetical protein